MAAVRSGRADMTESSSHAAAGMASRRVSLGMDAQVPPREYQRPVGCAPTPPTGRWYLRFLLAARRAWSPAFASWSASQLTAELEGSPPGSRSAAGPAPAIRRRDAGRPGSRTGTSRRGLARRLRRRSEIGFPADTRRARTAPRAAAAADTTLRE